MEEKLYRYQDRAVAFLDVLGFKQKLKAFEDEALEFQTIAESIEEIALNYFSKQAQEFIQTFISALSLLDKSKFRYYLFSDNICITSISKTTLSDLLELLVVIADLFYEFAIKGYFLRGGIDYGKFIDYDSIAIGIPLANAYEIENESAIYPRIVLSDEFVKQFESYKGIDQIEYGNEFIETLIKSSCEIKYLNVFIQVFKLEQREAFFQSLNESINANLKVNDNNEKVFVKYQWLANEFDSFIAEYVTYLAYIDSSFEPSDEHLEFVNQQIIDYGH